MKTKFLMIAMLMLAFAGCKDDESEPVDTTDNTPRFEFIELKTSFGDMYIWLHDSTPLHKENFLKLAKEDFYDSTEFHRIVKDFVIQGGDPNSKDNDRTNDGRGGPGYTIPAEIDSSMFKHVYGAVAAARLSDRVNPERASSGSQFYVVTDKNGEHGLDGAYTVFGMVLKGMDVADVIQGQKANSSGLPDERIPMDINVLSYTAAQLKAEFNFVP